MPEIRYPKLDFDDPLVPVIIALERERDALLSGTTPPHLLFELHDLLQIVTSLVSARIEGNRTSVVDAIEAARRSGNPTDDGAQEIVNILEAIDFVDRHAPTEPLTHGHVRELHRIVTSGLAREGDPTPGAYRLGFVSITESAHVPPAPADVLDHMTELLGFIDEVPPAHKQLLQVAIAHHAFLWIHPFGNGNGRVARLLSYWMLVRLGFSRPGTPRTVNPTTVFGADRDGYYDALEAADTLDDAGLARWCGFVLIGIDEDLRRMARLTDAGWVERSILLPSIARMQRAGLLSGPDATALTIAAGLPDVRAADLVEAYPGSPSSRSNAIRALIDRGLLRPTAPGRRRYVLAFATTELAGFVIATLDEIGMIPKVVASP